MMKKILSFVFIASPLWLLAQDFSAKWDGLFSYAQINDLAFADGTIYAAAENAVFSYSLNSKKTSKTSTVQGLSGENIAAIHYSKNTNELFIAYQNGLLEIVPQTKNKAVFSVIDIVEKQGLSPSEKRINHLYEYEGKLYLSTNYGISVYHIKNREFGETYYITPSSTRLKVQQITVLNNTIYAATSQGLKYANRTDFLIDPSAWKSIVGDWEAVVNFNGTLYAVKEQVLFKIEGNSSASVFLFKNKGAFKELRATEESLVLTTHKNVFVFKNILSPPRKINLQKLPYESLNCAYATGSAIFVGGQTKGLMQVVSPSKIAFISPSGPLQNTVFDLKVAPGRLWVVFGGYDINFNPYPLNQQGVSLLADKMWVNFPYDSIGKPKDLVDIAINPTNPKQVFISSYFSGILEFEDAVFKKLYTDQTSNLTPTPKNTGATDIRIGGMAFNTNGDLYVVNGFIKENVLKKLNASGYFENIDVSQVFRNSEEEGVGEMVIDNFGNVYFGTFSSGIIAYQASSGATKALSNNTAGVNFPEDYSGTPVISALAFDHTNQLWIGTEKGLRVLNNPVAIFQNGADFSVNPIVFSENGVAQELLYGQFITDIAVDGNNQKWISTADAGIFHVSENGQKTLAHFTDENSPLPSNTVNAVEVDPVSGMVYIGTSKGLVSYQGTAIQAVEGLAEAYVYPNPVHPRYTGKVTIAKLSKNTNVKITDISGNLVYETVSDGGSVQWDTRSFRGDKVASGVYLILLTGGEALQTNIIKIMIIR